VVGGSGGGPPCGVRGLGAGRPWSSFRIHRGCSPVAASGGLVASGSWRGRRAPWLPSGLCWWSGHHAWACLGPSGPNGPLPTGPSNPCLGDGVTAWQACQGPWEGSGSTFRAGRVQGTGRRGSGSWGSTAPGAALQGLRTVPDSNPLYRKTLESPTVCTDVGTVRGTWYIRWYIRQSSRVKPRGYTVRVHGQGRVTGISYVEPNTQRTLIVPSVVPRSSFPLPCCPTSCPTIEGCTPSDLHKQANVLVPAGIHRA